MSLPQNAKLGAAAVTFFSLFAFSLTPIPSAPLKQ